MMMMMSECCSKSKGQKKLRSDGEWGDSNCPVRKRKPHTVLFGRREVGGVWK